MSHVAELLESLDYGPSPESPAPVLEWLDARGRVFGLFLGGRWQPPQSGEFFETINPANGKPLARAAQAGAADVDAAVAAAAAAQPAWSALGGHGRARYLYALARAVQRHARFLAVLESLDNGKPIRESRDIDVPLVARHFYHHAGWAQLVESEFEGYRPIGVVGQIIPWNFPLLMLAWKVAPAIAAGNTVVLKPAELTPLTALRFAELCTEVGLPAGVVNIITGDGRAGELIVRHPGVRKIAFTGSTEVGRAIRIATAGSDKQLSLELGGKSPFIVHEDADLDSVVEGVVDAIWFNQGQVCCAGSRILAQEGIAERLTARLKARMEQLRIGDPLDKSIDIGAIIGPAQLQKIEELVRRGTEEGAQIWQPSWSRPTDGYFHPPTLCTDVSPASTIAQVEIFGPVVVLMTFRSPDEAVALANNTRYGLAASVWTENIDLALDTALRVTAGTVWINCTNVFDAAAGFGGYRESGFGREGGMEGMWEYLVPPWHDGGPVPTRASPAAARADRNETRHRAGASSLPGVDRTWKLYIDGRQVRPDQGYSAPVFSPDGQRLAEISLAGRKDVREAVEAAHHAADWTRRTAHERAQVLYYLAENMDARRATLVETLRAMTGCTTEAAEAELNLSVERLFHWAGWADKFDGRIHHTARRILTLAVHEPLGVMGIICSDHDPLLGFVSATAPALAMGNRVVAVPSEAFPLAALELYHLLDTSDVPGGVLNILTGHRSELTAVLAAHDGVDGVWYFAADEGGAEVERLSAGNLKRTWTANGRTWSWRDPVQGTGRELLRRATQVKNIWIPWGA